MSSPNRKIKPLRDYVFVKRDEAVTTKNGIFLPESTREKPRRGTVVATGPGKRDQEGHLIPMEVKEGDVVFFSSYAGREVNEDSDYLLMSMDEILVKVQ